MRSIIQFCMSAVCIGLVGAGLYMSLDSTGHGVVLDKPGSPGRLVADSSTATAFFELEGDDLVLTMLFSDEDEPDSVFRTRVTLAKGQSHSIVVADSEEEAAPQRFVFHRSGDTVKMSLDAATAMTASYTPNQ